jgi:hypothetical protein
MSRSPVITIKAMIFPLIVLTAFVLLTAWDSSTVG